MGAAEGIRDDDFIEVDLAWMHERLIRRAYPARIIGHAFRGLNRICPRFTKENRIRKAGVAD